MGICGSLLKQPIVQQDIWQASDYVEHYRYGQDRNFLKNHAFSRINEEAVEFFADYLFRDSEGYLTSGHSVFSGKRIPCEGESAVCFSGLYLRASYDTRTVSSVSGALQGNRRRETSEQGGRAVAGAVSLQSADRRNSCRVAAQL